MAQENLEIVRAAFRAARDLDRRAAAAVFAPDAEWHNTTEFPGPRVCIGPDAIIDFWITLVEDVATEGNEIEQVREVDGRVVVALHQWGCARRSGVPFDVRYAAIFEIVDRRIARVFVHGHYAKALAAVGLSE
jgi:ketosteroid isomerase-like protein